VTAVLADLSPLSLTLMAGFGDASHNANSITKSGYSQ